MGDYKRLTKEIPFGKKSPDVMQSIQKYVELHNLGNILDDISPCIVSTLEKVKKRRLVHWS